MAASVCPTAICPTSHCRIVSVAAFDEAERVLFSSDFRCGGGEMGSSSASSKATRSLWVIRPCKSHFGMLIALATLSCHQPEAPTGTDVGMAGERVDAGADAGEPPDAAQPQDAGMPVDAGQAPDSGQPPDGGMRPDSGPGCEDSCPSPGATTCSGAAVETCGVTATGCLAWGTPEACSEPNATAGCASGACNVAACTSGFADCDQDASNGCEVNVDSDPAHCGTCANACDGGSCVDGTCCATCGGSTCLDLSSDPAHCGSCDQSCRSGEICSGASCGFACAGDEDCASHSQAPWCDLLRGLCVACTSANACSSLHTCVIWAGSGIPGSAAMCVNDGYDSSCSHPFAGLPIEDCAGLPDQPVCDTTINRCVQCLSASDCPADGGYVCNGEACAAHCTPIVPIQPGRTCSENGECFGPEHLCDTTQHACVQCLQQSDCQGNQVCTHGTCANTLTNCNGTCADLTQDPNDCGACGNACAADSTCVNGTCVTCPDAGSDCSNVCKNLRNDPSNCGHCANVCMANDTCVDGQCTPCPAFPDAGVPQEALECSNVCVDWLNDPNNCSGCGNVCPSGVCRGGNCISPCLSDAQCSGGTPYCDVIGGFCVGCLTSIGCPTGEVCEIRPIGANGAQSFCDRPLGSCGAGTWDCSQNPEQPVCDPSTGDCVQCLTSADCPDGGYVCNAGACAESCAPIPAPASICTGGDICPRWAPICDEARGLCGVCAEESDCPTGMTCELGQCVGNIVDCDGTCADLTSDPNNCGSCGHSCGDGLCVDGSCQPCPSGDSVCSHTCVDLSSDHANCGACGNACPSNSTCTNASCVPCPDGDAGYSLWGCTGYCADFRHDPDNCGACGNVCPGGTLCVNENCEIPCTTDADCAFDGGTLFCNQIGFCN